MGRSPGATGALLLLLLAAARPAHANLAGKPPVRTLVQPLSPVADELPAPSRRSALAMELSAQPNAEMYTKRAARGSPAGLGNTSRMGSGSSATMIAEIIAEKARRPRGLLFLRPRRVARAVAAALLSAHFF